MGKHASRVTARITCFSALHLSAPVEVLRSSSGPCRSIYHLAPFPCPCLQVVLLVQVLAHEINHGYRYRCVAGPWPMAWLHV